jgi:hypothetical protein
MITKTLKFQAHAKLLQISKNALDTITKRKGKSHECNQECCVQLWEDELAMIATDYAISSLEAFINHIGYILDNDWLKYQNKNFRDQYKRLINILNKINISCDDVKISPYNQFDKHRKIRNTLHHVHASEHNTKKIARPDSLPTAAELNETFEMLQGWVNSVDFKSAKDVYDNVRGFMEKLCAHVKVKENLHLAEKLIKHGDKDQRQDALRTLIESPFYPIASVTGNGLLPKSETSELKF